MTTFFRNKIFLFDANKNKHTQESGHIKLKKKQKIK
jgi:hypothetical protein